MTKSHGDPFETFVAGFTALVDETADEAQILERGGPMLARLVAQDGWLPDAYATPGAERYKQYLLYLDPDARFSVVSFVWGPGQGSPVHDHTVWGLVGVLRGAELCQAFAPADGAPRPVGEARRLTPGQIVAVSPRVGDIHKVDNALADRASVSIHVYGADIGATRRSIFDARGAVTPFVSRYADRPPLRAAAAEVAS
jgi:predicted metal-dependent enzyme (double-stranded beta helix superfamily)